MCNEVRHERLSRPGKTGQIEADGRDDDIATLITRALGCGLGADCRQMNRINCVLTLRQYSKISSLSLVHTAFGSGSVTQRLFSSRY